VNCFPFGFVFVTLEAFLRVGIFFERNRVSSREGRSGGDEYDYSEQQRREAAEARACRYRIPILSCERHLT
jgi:hypothetical protein